MMLLFAENQGASSYRSGDGQHPGSQFCKIINTQNMIYNGGEKLEPEFKAHIGGILAEEDFAASQPGQAIVRRDQEAETDKLGEFLQADKPPVHWLPVRRSVSGLPRFRPWQIIWSSL